jgi:hypothetical protein
MIRRSKETGDADEIEMIRRLAADFMINAVSLPPIDSQEQDGVAPPLVEAALGPIGAAASVELLGDVGMVLWAEVVNGQVVVQRLALLRRAGRWLVMPPILH